MALITRAPAGYEALAPAANTGDPVALDHDNGIGDWCATIAVNERAAFDDQRGGLWRLRRNAAEDSQQ